MPRSLKQHLLMPHHPLQPPTRRLTVRFQVDIIVQIGIQKGYNPQELSHQPVEESTDSLMASKWVMNLTILGIRILLLMSRRHVHNHTHNIVPLLALCTWTNHPNRGREQPHRQNNNINVRSGNAPYPRP